MLNELNTNCWKKKKISAKLYHPAVHTYMYNVHCTLCTMYCTYSVQCTVYNDSITTNNYVDLQQQCYWLTSVPRAQPPNPKSTTIKVQEHSHPSPKAQPSKSKSTTIQVQKHNHPSPRAQPANPENHLSSNQLFSLCSECVPSSSRWARTAW